MAIRFRCRRLIFFLSLNFRPNFDPYMCRLDNQLTELAACPAQLPPKNNPKSVKRAPRKQQTAPKAMQQTISEILPSSRPHDADLPRQDRFLRHIIRHLKPVPLLKHDLCTPLLQIQIRHMNSAPPMTRYLASFPNTPPHPSSSNRK